MPGSIPEPQLEKSPGGRKGILLATILTAIFMAYLYVTQSIRSQIPDHGDYYTDMAHILAARNLDSYGFVPLCFGTTRDRGHEVGLAPSYWQHHPSFPAVLLGLFYRWGFSTTEARVGPLLFSSSALIAIYLLTCRMLRDWRAGLVALLALAAAAPFHLFADAFGYQSYDFAAKMWSVLFITLGSLAEERRRLAWFIAAGMSAFATIALSGFEMVPAIGVYSLLFPLLFVSAQWKERFQVMLMSGLYVGAGLLVGMLSRLAHNICMLGGLEQVIADLIGAFSLRSATTQYDLGQLYSLIELRALAYYPIHLVVAILGVMVIGLLGIVRRRNWRALDWYALRWLGLIFFAENLWFFVFRQHSYIHTHTIYHLSLSMSLAVTMSVIAIWRVASCSPLGRRLAAVAGVGLFAVSLTDVVVGPLSGSLGGNLQIKLNWDQAERQIAIPASLLPEDAVVVILDNNMNPNIPFFLKRIYVERPEVANLSDLRGRPWFMLTLPERSNQIYDDALASKRLMALTLHFALFDMSATPGMLNSIVLGTKPLSSQWAHEVGLRVFIMHTPAPGMEEYSALSITLPPGKVRTITFWATQPEWVINKAEGDKIKLTFAIDTHNIVTTASISLSPTQIKQKYGWIPVDITVPESDTPSMLRIDVGCGAKGSCNDNWVWVAPVSERLVGAALPIAVKDNIKDWAGRVSCPLDRYIDQRLGGVITLRTFWGWETKGSC